MKTIEFFRASRAVQDRFTHSARGLSQPAPVLFKARVAVGWQVALLGSGLALAGGLAAAAIGFADPNSPLAISPAWMSAVYGGLVFLVFLGLLVARVRYKAPRLLPYLPGHYLFPFGVIDASTPSFRVFALDELLTVEASGTQLTLKFKEAQFQFEVGKADEAKQLVTSVQAGKLVVESLLGAMNHRELAALDPLRDTGFSNPFSPKTPHQQPVQRRLFLAMLVVALPVSAGLGWGFREFRNTFSEQRLFDRACLDNTPSAYQKYLERGGKRAVVVDTFLPRAELALAARTGNVSELDAFGAKHPENRIAAEIRAALKNALLAELRRAKAVGTVSALRAFRERFAVHLELFAPEYARAQAEFYAGILAKYEESPTYSPKLVTLVGRLLNLSRNSPAQALVRFRRVLRASLTLADRQVQKSLYYMGPESLPSQYFDAKSSAPREARVGETLIKKWQQIFPEDVLKFSLGPAVEETEGTPIVFPVPTLLVEYVVGGAGIFLSKKPRGVFVGVGLVFIASFSIPDVAESLEFKGSSWKVPDFTSLAGGEGTVKGVYESVAQDGFDRFLRLYDAEYFQAGAPHRAE